MAGPPHRPVAPAPVPTEGDAPPQAPAAASATSNAALLGIATIVARLATFALAVVLARKLGVEDYGRYGLAVALALVVLPLADLGLTPYLLREVARDRRRAEAGLRTILLAKLGLSLAVLVITGAIAVAVVKEGALVAVIVVMLVSTLSDGIAQLVFGYFQGRERMGLEAGLTSTTSIARSLGGIVFALAFAELMPVLAWLLAVGVIQVTWAGLRLREAVREPGAATVPTERAPISWQTVIAMGLITIFVMVYLRADTVLVGALKNERAVGFYTAAYTLMLGLQIVPWVVSTALTPVFARAWAAGDKEKFAEAWHGGIRAVLVVSLPLAMVACLLAYPIIERMFGDDYDPAGEALVILVWASPLAALNVMLTGALRGLGRERWITAVSGAGAVLNVGLNLWAIPTFGIDGAAAVTVGTEVIVIGLFAVLARSRQALPFPRLPYLRLGVALGALAAIAILARPLPVEVAVVLALLGFAGVAVVTRVVGARDAAALREVVGARLGRR